MSVFVDITPEEAAAELLAELRNRGWQAGGEWKDGALQVQVTLLTQRGDFRAALARSELLLALCADAEVPQRDQGVYLERQAYCLAGLGRFDEAVAVLEGGAHGFAFASGLGASTTLLHTLSPGDHVLSGDDVYGGTFRLLDKVMKPLGIASSFVDMTDIDRVRAALRPDHGRARA